nr:1709_t:CDS:2 [Entrophospora candida]
MTVMTVSMTKTLNQNVNDDNQVHRNMIYNQHINQNSGEIYRNVGNNNYMAHQNLEDIYQNACNDDYIRQTMIYNHQNNFVTEPNSDNITSINRQNSVDCNFVNQNNSNNHQNYTVVNNFADNNLTRDQKLIYITSLLQNIQNVVNQLLDDNN